MIALIQRVKHATVEVAGQSIGAIGPGLLVLVAVQPQDNPQRIERMAERLLGYRVFNDAAGKMNLSVQAVSGGVLLVSQFTLAADTDSGLPRSIELELPAALGGGGTTIEIGDWRSLHGVRLPFTAEFDIDFMKITPAHTQTAEEFSVSGGVYDGAWFTKNKSRMTQF